MPRSSFRRRSPRRLVLALASALLLAVVGSTGASAVAPSTAGAAQRELYDYYVTTTHPSCGRRCDNVPTKGGARMAERVLRDCFNCVFPVSGAPRSYPRDGQFLPLKACPVLGVCNAPVRFNEVRGNGWFGFDAQPGHFDGAGSQVYFRFYKQPSTGYLRLRVRGLVTDPKIPDAVNRTFAQNTWRRFAQNMGAAVYRR